MCSLGQKSCQFFQSDLFLLPNYNMILSTNCKNLFMLLEVLNKMDLTEHIRFKRLKQRTEPCILNSELTM